ncbi:uncharacterized protein METZ01_LOCUS310016, partial [marine metagenome]
KKYLSKFFSTYKEIKLINAHKLRFYIKNSKDKFAFSKRDYKAKQEINHSKRSINLSNYWNSSI